MYAFTLADHGKRARYAQGCRCDECRRANSLYERLRLRLHSCGLAQPNPLVPAAAVVAHILKLRRDGIGRCQISRVAKVPASTISLMLAGERLHIRKQTADRILAMTYRDRANGAHIRAGLTWKRIDELLEHGFSKRRIARELGYRSPALQLNRSKVTKKNAEKVEKLWRKYMTIEGA
jgi:hypothetical protein